MQVRWVRKDSVTPFIIASVLGLSCTEQHRPEAHHAAIKAERLAANQPSPKLNSDGTIPAQGGAAAASVSGNPKYDTLCASCHGLDGAASTPTASALNPKPRNLTDAAWQGKVDDAHIAKVISEGGASVGLSPTMAPWGSMLSKEEVTALVATIRKFKK